MDLGIIKNGDRGIVGLIPNNYPARNIAYNNTTSGLTADDVQEAIDELAQGGGSSGGHSIMNEAEQVLTQRPTLQMMDIHTSDDSVNLRTELEVIKKLTKAQLDSLGENTDGFYMTTDEEDIEYTDPEEDSVSVTADGTKTYATLLSELFALIDYSKVTTSAKIVITSAANNTSILAISRISSTNYRFCMLNSASTSYIREFVISIGSSASNCHYTQNQLASGGNTITNYDSTAADDGEKITFYYGTSSSIINLKTDADNCMMSDGVTSVEDALGKLKEIKKTTVTGPTNSAGVLTSSLGSNKVVLSATRHDQSSEYNVIQPYYHSIDNVWYFKIMNVAGSVTANNPGVSVDVYYIDV